MHLMTDTEIYNITQVQRKMLCNYMTVSQPGHE